MIHVTSNAKIEQNKGRRRGGLSDEGFQTSVEFFHGISISAGNCILRQSQRFGDLSKCQFFPMFQDNDFILILRQCFQQPPHSIRGLFVDNLRFSTFFRRTAFCNIKTSSLSLLDDSQRFIAHRSDQIRPWRIGFRQQSGSKGNSGKCSLHGILSIRLIPGNCHSKPNQSLSCEVKHLGQRKFRMLRQAGDAVSKTCLKVSGCNGAHGITKSRSTVKFVCRIWKFSPRTIFSAPENDQCRHKTAFFQQTFTSLLN